MILVSLNCLASQFTDADRPVTKIVGQFDTDALISLSLLV